MRKQMKQEYLFGDESFSINKSFAEQRLNHLAME